MELHFASARGSSVSTLTVTLTVYQCVPLPDKLRTPACPESTSPSSSPRKCAEAKIMPIYKDDARIGTGTSHSYVSLSRSSFFFPPCQGAPFCEPSCIFLTP
ncbi:hypothetical protein KP509_06G087400 [Ceratopteris richardii]|uniref:Uncharacterized protein n=1 Tax=Ceratopteris richardii TaxID=49495 RepID=A0A8T2UMN3_CERRI|nr:hypothetical protein KP509_06G087400 [Ceratopteris richardii]